MADNPFAGLGDPQAGENIGLPSAESQNFRKEPLSTNERLILQNFFDTQPERRKAYLKQIGFEMDPNNTNKIKPLKSPGPFNIEIDPGISAYFKKGGLKELAKDFGDIQTDILKGSAVTAAGSAGAAGGTAVGAALGGVPALVTAPAGAFIAGAAAAASSELSKKFLGDTLLDESIPLDKRILLTDSIINGLFAGGGTAIKEVSKLRLQAAKQAAENVLEKSGIANPEVLDYAVKNPEKFTKAKVAGATEEYLKVHDEFFGLDPEKAQKLTDFDQIPTDSFLGQHIAPLREEANAEIAKLTANREANVNIGQAVGKVKNIVDELSSTHLLDEEAEKTLDGSKAILKKALAEAKKITGNNKLTYDDLDKVSFDYGSARRLLRVIKDKAQFETKGGVLKSSGVLGAVAHDARVALDQVAEANGSHLPQLNQLQSEVLNDFKAAQRVVNPNSLFQAYSGNSGTAATKVKTFMQNLGTKYHTDFGDYFEEPVARAYFEQRLTNPGSVPNLFQRVLNKGVTGTLREKGIDLATGVNSQELMANPEKALQTLSTINQQIQGTAPQAFPGLIGRGVNQVKPLVNNVLTTGTSRNVAPVLSPLLPESLNSTEDENPFKGLGD